MRLDKESEERFVRFIERMPPVSGPLVHQLDSVYECRVLPLLWQVIADILEKRWLGQAL